ncbi:MAG: hypothetical protein QXS54_02575 [Candidatus Methanomethylicaceae archaeon]
MSKDTEYFLSFENVCKYLLIDPDKVRKVYREQIGLAMSGNGHLWPGVVHARIMEFLMSRKNELHTVVAISDAIKVPPFVLRLVTVKMKPKLDKDLEFVRMRRAGSAIAHSVILVGIFEKHSESYRLYRDGRLALPDGDGDDSSACDDGLGFDL